MRQVEIYQRVKAQHSYAPAHMLKRAVTDTEISVNHSRFVFIGREMYESAGGVVREDLFSAQEGDGTADGVLVERLVQEKLESAALAIELQEGWSWSLAREGAVRNYGDDREHYLLLPEPEAQYTTDEQQRLDELYATQEATETFEDEAAIQVLIDEIENAASIRAWTPEQKSACGVVVSLYDGELCVQRGVQKKPQNEAKEGQGENGSSGSLHVISSKPDVTEGISAPLLKKMSSERTLAVQAALIQQPEKAVALMVWRLCSCVFDYCNTTRHTPETVSSWSARWSGTELRQYDREDMFWRWSERFPSLAPMERWMTENQPFWTVMAETDALARESPEFVRYLERWMVPNKLTAGSRV